MEKDKNIEAIWNTMTKDAPDLESKIKAYLKL
jgi:hypothetical protein